MDKERSWGHAPEERWYFLSFRDPKTNVNLGCCNVAVTAVKGGLEVALQKGFQAALQKTRQLGINPGGEAMGFLLREPELEPDRLYSREEMIRLGYEKI